MSEETFEQFKRKAKLPRGLSEDETAWGVSGAQLRDALIAGFDAALAEASRDPVGARSEIEARMYCRGYDALASERFWLESNR